MSAIGLFEMSPDEGVMDLVQHARQLLTVAAAPFLPANKPTDLPPREGDFVADRLAVIGVLLQKRHEHLVGERPGLPELRIGTYHDVAMGVAPAEMNLIGAFRRGFLIMTKERPGDAEQSALHIELILNLALRRLSCCRGVHTQSVYRRSAATRGDPCGERLLWRAVLRILCRLTRVRRSQEGREHPLQASDQHVGLSAALCEFLDLRILGGDLATQEIHFAFETRDIAWFGVAGRGLSRLVVPSSVRVSRLVVLWCRRFHHLRHASRQVAACRELSSAPVGRCRGLGRSKKGARPVATCRGLSLVSLQFGRCVVRPMLG